jgi:hypothetical protein
MSQSPKPLLVRGANTVAWSLTAALLVVGLGTLPQGADTLVPAAEPFDPEIILPGRVDADLHRTYDAVQRASAAVDDRRHRAARKASAAATTGFGRSLKAVMHQVEAVPPPGSEEESTAGPDSVLASLNVSQASINTLATLFDGVRAPRLITAVSKALAAAQQRRATLITAIAALDPEEAGAPYADGLTDTVPFYTDEVAGIQEALQDDALTPAAKTALNQALTRSQNAEAAMTAAFGGGE